MNDAPIQAEPPRPGRPGRIGRFIDGLRRDRELLIGGEVRSEASLLRIGQALERAARSAGWGGKTGDAAAGWAADMRLRCDGTHAMNFSVGLRRAQAERLAEALHEEGLTVEVVRNPEGFARQASFPPLRLHWNARKLP